jgi:DNA repair protein RadC
MHVESSLLHRLRQVTGRASGDTPRRRLGDHGVKHLSDAELLAVLFDQRDADSAQRLLTSFGSLRALLGAEPLVLQSKEGLGPKEATTLLAAVELCRRARAVRDPRPRFSSPADLYRYLAPHLEGLRREVFHVLCLDASKRLLLDHRVTEGSIDQCPVDPRDVFAVALASRASALILAHNHPSGDATPSALDRQLTARLVAGAALLQLHILDHIIVADGQYVSFLERGLLSSERVASTPHTATALFTR